MRARITKLLREAATAQAEPDPYGFLPGIIETLKVIRENQDISDNERRKLSGGLGRLVLEDFEFADSSLGTALLMLADDFAEGKLEDK